LHIPIGITYLRTYTALQAGADDTSSKPQVVAYLMATLTSVNMHVGKLVTRPDWRRRGVARTLLTVRS
jgi:ribosomal protein S18 acetylase RimI-like enzyme